MWVKGAVLIYTWPTYPPHGAMLGAFTRQFGATALAPEMFTVTGSWSDGVAISKQPDNSWVPNSLPTPDPNLNANGESWPRVVLEVASRNGGAASLHSRCMMWLSPTTQIQVVIGIKLYKRRGAGNVPMVIARYERNAFMNPVIKISFGSIGMRTPARTAWNGTVFYYIIVI